MSKKVKFVALLIISVSSLFCSNLDLNSFKTPEMHRQSLFLSGGLGSSLLNFDVEMGPQSYKQFGYKNNLGGSLKYLYLTELRESSSHLESYFSFLTKTLSENENIENKYGNDLGEEGEENDHNGYDIQQEFGISGRKRVYMMETPLFLEGSLGFDQSYRSKWDKEDKDIDIQSYYQNENTNEVLKYDQISTSAEVSPTISFGYGRIENISDIRKGIEIVKQLKESNLISRMLTREELIQLGELIAKIENDRVFDFREKKKYQLKSINDFFLKLGVLESTNIDFFTTLSDTWQYYKNSSFTGDEIKCNIFSSYQTQWEENEIKKEITDYITPQNNYTTNKRYTKETESKGVGFSIQYDRAYSIDLHWGYNLNTLAYLNKEYIDSKVKNIYKENEDTIYRDTIDRDDNHLTQIYSIKNSIEYIPTSRTKLKLSNILKYENYYTKRDEVSESSYFGEDKYSSKTRIEISSIELNLSGIYQLSMETKILARVGVQYSNQTQDNFRDGEKPGSFSDIDTSITLAIKYDIL
ncbi:MAG: hypothetical protein CR982_10445 [Candidatus Cloacimonadota bacterium]|nr:MAG: hypothetical protein CR982_10445 [Candidatus Cloacimonadota bacterium]PIE79704.1 MAG: hypothetical protein CSA15_02705 [Candidatus Delongbacteria bacterium]